MIAPLEVQKGMELPPQACVLCGNNPVDDITGEQLPVIFAPGVDVDWGGSVYICWSCTNIIADLAGRVTVAGFDALTEKYEELKNDHEALEEAYERDTKLVRQIREGQAAVKTAKGDKPKKAKAA